MANSLLCNSDMRLSRSRQSDFMIAPISWHSCERNFGFVDLDERDPLTDCALLVGRENVISSDPWSLTIFLSFPATPPMEFRGADLNSITWNLDARKDRRFTSSSRHGRDSSYASACRFRLIASPIRRDASDFLPPGAFSESILRFFRLTAISSTFPLNGKTLYAFVSPEGIESESGISTRSLAKLSSGGGSLRELLRRRTSCQTL
mmetsp:Transcript_37865/g.90620  ORF Transcript_37865/g.90620 Transcript_37865/m.90620 type:complete len:206 (-) Transcript_37865:265-882(-)